MEYIDLRSDTVTLPTSKMMESINHAILGDDVFGEDPTVNCLEKIASDMMGKEASLLIPSGTMGNLICVLTHCGRGDEVILGDRSHIFINEAGGMSVLGGVHPHIVPNQDDGTILTEDIREAIRGDDIHYPTSRLICLENTHNRCYGSPLRPDYMEKVFEISRENNLYIHLDGARIFNASVALDLSVTEFTKYVDSIMFCLSKGLSAPVGSVVCGSRDFIERARRIRKVLGGGMRQAGIIAAPGIISLEKMVGRMSEDHENAKILATGLSEIKGISIDAEKVKTNILYFGIEDENISPDEFLMTMDNNGLKFLKTGRNRYRMVTHYGVKRDDIELVLKIVKGVMDEYE